MRKLLIVALAVMLALSVVACSDNSGTSNTPKPSTSPASQQPSGNPSTDTSGNDTETVPADFKVGFIFIGDENEGYTEAHIIGAKAVKEKFKLKDDQVIIRYNVPENEKCKEAADDLVDQGCKIIFANSFGHEGYMLEAAKENPDVQFCHATGFQAASSGADNMHNFFTAVYESRYVSGVVAGLKLKELYGEDNDKKIGYVGAFSYAEVVSGYTSFFLGVRSVCPNVTMEVKYTGSWADQSKEKETADALIANGCVLISQHADTTGAPAACEQAGVYVVGYNVSMISVAPNYALTSASIKWAPYMTYAVGQVLKGEKIDTDWSKGYADDAVWITELNANAVAPGTEDVVKTTIDAIKAGTLHVFDTSKFTVDGKKLTTTTDIPEDSRHGKYYGQEYIKNGYFQESVLGSAPSFAFRIDGIQELNSMY